MHIFRQALRKFVVDGGPFMASGLAFDLLLCFIPLSLLMVSALGYIIGGGDRALSEVQRIFGRVLPFSHNVITDGLAGIVANRGVIGLLGLGLLALLGSAIFGSTRLVLNRAFAVDTEGSFIRGKFHDLITLFGTSILLVVVIALESFMTFLREFGERFSGLGSILQPGWLLAGRVLSFLFVMGFFYLLYRLSPVTSLSRASLRIGAFAGAILFELSKWGFTIYVSFAEQLPVFYGTVGSLLFFFLWLYYSCAVFILGAEIAWVHDSRSG